jgi:hypothetical protein
MRISKTKYFLAPRTLVLFGLFLFSNFLFAHEVQKTIYQRYAKPRFTFSQPVEVFDSSFYQAERYSVYQYLYSFFEKNPINFKSLKTGNLILHFSHHNNSEMYTFDSALNPTSAQNIKVLKLFGKNFSSPIISDSNTLTLQIFIRKSNKVSKSLDTFDLFSSKNKFIHKTKLDVIEKGIYINKTLLLKSIIEPHQIKPKEYNSFGEELLYVNIAQRAEFRGGNSAFNDFLDNNVVIPNQLKDEEFPCRLKVFFEVNVEGKIQNISFERKRPSDTYSENLYKLMENELIRILKRQPIWRPKMFNGRYLKSRYSVDFNLSYES